jgi:peptidoglycan LD-endopeptidase LytH
VAVRVGVATVGVLLLTVGLVSSVRGPVAAARAAGRPAQQASAPKHVAYRFPVAHCKFSYSHSHHDYPATDIFANTGCRFVAPVSGRVDEVQRHDHWNPRTNLGSTRGGLSVSIVGVDGGRYYGSHLSKIASGIRPGVKVVVGELLGRVGRSGDARFIGSHLHFGISWPTRKGIWWIRRGEVWPWRYLDAWHAHRNNSPVHAVRLALKKAGRRVPPCSADC